MQLVSFSFWVVPHVVLGVHGFDLNQMGCLLQVNSPGQSNSSNVAQHYSSYLSVVNMYMSLICGELGTGIWSEFSSFLSGW